MEGSKSTNNYGSERLKTYGSGTLLITIVQVGTIQPEVS